MGSKAQLTPTMKLELGDIELTLRADLKAFRIFRDITGTSILLGDWELHEGTIAPLVYAMAASGTDGLWDLAAAAPLPAAEVTPESVEASIGLGNVVAVLEIVSDILEKALETMEGASSGKKKGAGAAVASSTS